jgi:glycosyltransferase involved in cell wall biosynthesis
MKRIAVFVPVGTFDHQTGVINAIKCFALHGYKVDVFTVRNKLYPKVNIDSPNVHITYMPFSYKAQRESRILITLVFLLWIFVSGSRFNYPLVFAAGIRGLFSAYVYSLFRPVQIINYQTELYVDNNPSSVFSRLFKKLERSAAKRSSFTIEHDENRREILCQDLGIDISQVVVVPNSPCGPAKCSSSTYLHNLLDVSIRRKILLAPGTIGEAFASTKVVRLTQSLPDEWRCVLHSVHPRSAEETYIKRLMELNHHDRVVFSLSPVAYSQVNEVISSATIGLVLYSGQSGLNMSSVGLSSGKLSHFLKLGIPVIVSDLPGLSDFVRLHKVGEVLENEYDLAKLVQKIDSDILAYRKRCLDCFNEFLAYERHFEKVIEHIEEPILEVACV